MKALRLFSASSIQSSFSALLSINTLQLFPFVMDLCLLVFVSMGIIIFFRKQELINFGAEAFFDVKNLLLFLLLLAIIIFHASLNALYWFSFAHGLILFAVIGTATLTADYLLFAEHYSALKKALAAMNRPSKKNLAKREAQLCGLLRQNAALFRFVFAGSAFYGGNFLLYMILHVPIAAVFSMEVLFKKHQSANSNSGSSFGLSQIFMTGNVSEAGIGTFLIHLYCAYFFKYLHRSGQMLLKFSLWN